MGAAKIVGVDASGEMVDAAASHPAKRNVEHYVGGDVTDLKRTLLKTANKTLLRPGVHVDRLALFDLTVAVYVFNRLSITYMESTFKV